MLPGEPQTAMFHIQPLLKISNTEVTLFFRVSEYNHATNSLQGIQITVLLLCVSTQA